MGFSIPHLLVVLAIVLVLFGTKRLRNVGGDLGAAIKSFRSAMKEGEQAADDSEDKVIDGEVTTKKNEKA